MRGAAVPPRAHTGASLPGSLSSALHQVHVDRECPSGEVMSAGKCATCPSGTYRTGGICRSAWVTTPGVHLKLLFCVAAGHLSDCPPGALCEAGLLTPLAGYARVHGANTTTAAAAAEILVCPGTDVTLVDSQADSGHPSLCLDNNTCVIGHQVTCSALLVVRHACYPGADSPRRCGCPLPFSRTLAQACCTRQAIRADTTEAGCCGRVRALWFSRPATKNGTA